MSDGCGASNAPQDSLNLSLNSPILGDCMDVLKGLPDHSIDMVLTDPPYNTTSCSWDKQPINFDELWKHLFRVCKPDAPMVFTAAQPFTTLLIQSNLEGYRYNWVWKKNRATNFQNAKKMPMRITEDIVVFGGKKYNPQGLQPFNKVKTNGKSVGGGILRDDIDASLNKGTLRTPGSQYIQEWTNYPSNLLEFSLDNEKLHPTQKPIALLEYLIRTYSDEGNVILDPFAGSGSTAVAAIKSKRDFIAIERDQKYYDILLDRVYKVLNDRSNSGI